jgi:hypothetical protein
VIVRGDLPPGLQLAQSGHALAAFCLTYPKLAEEWHNESNYLVCLSAPDEQSLFGIMKEILGKNFKVTPFCETDLKNELTAIAVEPHPDIERMVSRLPLALK